MKHLLINQTPLSILLLLIGSIVMAVSIVKYYSTLTFSQNFEKDSKGIWVSFGYKIHHMLMVFFLIGYAATIVLLAKNVNILGELFISVIFLFGAFFVLIGVILQNNLLQSIESERQKHVDKNIQLNELQDANIFTLAYLAEIRDSETGKHIERTSMYVRKIAIQLSTHPQYKNHLTTTYINHLVKSAPLHDIGKVGVKDAILNKPGKLTNEEFDEIKAHCEYGANILSIAESKVNFRSYLTLAIPLVRSHHERWDGKGYPDGLKGDEIPLSAQIMAVADVYDALRSTRCYKKSFTHEKATQIILSEKEKQFSPDVVEAFIKCEKMFNEISLNHSD